MADMKEVSSLHKSGFNCAQVVALLDRDLSGLDEKTAKAAMGGFGGGLRSGEVCGAVASGVYTLGLCFPYTDGGDLDAKARIAELTKRFVAAFREKFGCVTCDDLLKNVGGVHCEEFMAYAADLAREIVETEKNAV